VGVVPPPTHDPLAGLSRSERVVAELVAQGCTNREISERLVISRRTVETHVAHAFHKLGVHSRSHLAARVTRAVVGPWDDGR
jgi:non-specific serine/threonine protein kinase